MNLGYSQSYLASGVKSGDKRQYKTRSNKTVRDGNVVFVLGIDH